jgi:diaminohydroxyphosphoribosylaminopyrimidine deaminase/5-amino-6-(5-phosphoribosylamino)uracil reductase
MDFLFRTIELAAMADSRTFPNPKVGAVVVYDGKIIGEGYHQQAGGAHAEVHAIDAVRDKGLLPFSTLYVSLEPCNHHGKTPPCTDYILHHKIPKVVIGISDSNPMVAGTGIARLRAAGVEVIEHSITEPFWALNEIFFTNQSEQRPYIHLKWAESRDGFIAPLPAATFPITGMAANMLSHQLRAHHHAIMVGTNTAAIDNPRLDVRYAYGKSPLRIVWDTKGRLPRSLHLFQDGKPTLVIGKPRKDLEDLRKIV